MSEENKTQWIFRFLQWFCPDDLYEEIEGDLIQRYQKDVKNVGEQRAKRRLIYSVFRFFRPGIVLRNKFSLPIPRVTMIRNYTRLSIRHLMKRKLYSFINTTGLAVGIAVCLVIWRYVEFELSYDSFHTKANSIYRVMTTLYTDQQKIPHVGYDLAPALLDEVPEIRSVVRVHPLYDKDGVISLSTPSGEWQHFREPGIMIADSTFFDVFTYDFVQGSSATALANSSSVVITEFIAHKYFPGGENPIGKVLRLAGGQVDQDYQISAVIRDVPQNSHLTFDFLFPSHNLIHSDFYKDRPRWNGFFTYVEFLPAADIKAVERKMDAFIKRYQSTSDNPDHHAVIEFQPLRSIHTSRLPVEMGETDQRSDISVYFFLLISILVLGIAWVNYVNLSTARAMERAKEVGVKKALGVLRSQLIWQFIFESVLINFIGLVIAAGLAIAFLPVLSGIVGKTIAFDFSQPGLWLMLAGLFLSGSLIAGAYPAFVLSSFKTTKVINGFAEKMNSGFSLRKALVVFQFSASLLLLTGTFTIYRQVRFMQEHDKGMRTDQIVILEGPRVKDEKDKNFDFRDRARSFKNELLKLPGVRKVAASEVEPGGGHNWETHMYRLGATANEIIPGENMNVVFTDTDLIDTYGLELISGSVWNPEKASDMGSVLINEAAIAAFGLKDPENALRQQLVSEIDTVEIIGVLKNFHWQSLKTDHEPMILWPERIAYQRFSVLLDGNTKSALEQIEKLYAKMFPGNSFEYYFLDDFFNRQYKSDLQFEKVFSLFAALAIVIACLGLVGLASFTTSQRLREISIRKVLGATVESITVLLSNQFLRLLLAAGIITVPVTWYAVHTWLEDFPFRVPVTWDLFILPLLFLIVIALGSVILQIIRGARTNPAKALRSQ